MSEVKVNKVSPRSGTTVTIGDSGDTINIVGTLQNNGSPLAGDISSVVAGTGLSGGATSGVATLNIEAAQPTITSLGTITGFTSTGIDDNATSTAITIDSSQNVALAGDITTGNNGSLFLLDNAGQKSGQITTDNSTSNSLQIDADPDNSASGSYTAFRIDNSEKMRLDATGLALKTSAPAVTLDVRATSFTPYNTNTSLIVEAPAVFSQSQHFYMYNAGAYNSSRPTGGIGSVNASSLISLSAGSICNNNPGADGFKATATTSSLYDIGSGNHEFKTKTGLTVGDQFTHQTKMIIKDSGSVGIGTTNPQEQLDISSNSPRIRFSDTSVTDLHHKIGSEANDLEISCDAGNDQASSHIGFKVDGSERMRIDSSGNVYIGKTSGVLANVGHEFNAGSYASHTRDGDVTLYLNRKTSDGAIQEFRKDNTAIGRINVRSVYGVYEFGSLGTGIGGTNVNAWLPLVGNVRSDNTTSLGLSSYRMTTIFATTGTINTSDQNEKQSIQSLTTAEMNVGKKLSSLIKTFKWNSSVEEKGDSARTHTGIIAQDVQQAFTDEGLDATKYGLWCSDTWSIDADGEEIENPEEVTENNPSKTRLGIRYEQLLSFIQAYNDQRFTELEARITQLENA